MGINYFLTQRPFHILLQITVLCFCFFLIGGFEVQVKNFVFLWFFLIVCKLATQITFQARCEEVNNEGVRGVCVCVCVCVCVYVCVCVWTWDYQGKKKAAYFEAY